MREQGKAPPRSERMPDSLRIVVAIVTAGVVMGLILLLTKLGPILREVYSDITGRYAGQLRQGYRDVASFYLGGLYFAHLTAGYLMSRARQEVEAARLRVQETEAVAEWVMWTITGVTFTVYLIAAFMYLGWRMQGESPSSADLYLTLVGGTFAGALIQFMALRLSYGRRDTPYRHTLGGLGTYSVVPALGLVGMNPSLANVGGLVGLWLLSFTLQPIGDRLSRTVKRAHEVEAAAAFDAERPPVSRH